MKMFANFLGILAVAAFVSSYQLKLRRGIIILNAASRILYVAQYLLLGAFEGALLDVVAFFVSLLCQCRERGFVKKHLAIAIVLSNVVVVAAGMLTYKNVFSLLPILGVIFETLALWLTREKSIRLLSLLGAPFWLAYNLLNSAYGSAIGNVITVVSITAALIRYDLPKRAAEIPTENAFREDSEE